MAHARSGWVVLAAVTSFLAVGVPYWAVPYSKLNLPSALMGPGLLVIGSAALLLCASRAARLSRTLLVLGAVMPAVVSTRAFVEALGDPTSHNLWPLEVIISLSVGAVVVLPGAIVGALIARVIRGED